MARVTRDTISCSPPDNLAYRSSHRFENNYGGELPFSQTQKIPDKIDYEELTQVYLTVWEEVCGRVINQISHKGLATLILNIGTNKLVLIQLTEIPERIQIGDSVAVLKPDRGKLLFRIVEQEGGKLESSKSKVQYPNKPDLV